QHKLRWRDDRDDRVDRRVATDLKNCIGHCTGPACVNTGDDWRTVRYRDRAGVRHQYRCTRELRWIAVLDASGGELARGRNVFGSLRRARVIGMRDRQTQRI